MRDTARRHPRMAAPGAGLDTLEKSIIQSDIRSQFSLQGVENSLRAHWTDEQVRQRDSSESRHAANFEDFDISEDEGPTEWADEFFQDWTEDEISMFQDAQADVESALAQIQEGKRTLREAHAKQKKVRLGRRYFGGEGRGKSQGSGGRNFPRDRSEADGQGPCLRCGKAHSTRQCPQRPPGDGRKVLHADAQSEFIYQAETLFGDHMEDYLSAGAKMSTHEAMTQGYGVLDAGATRTMGPIVALEHARQVSLRDGRQDNVAEVNLSDRPVFGFADSESAQCSSTVLLQLPVAEQRMKLRVHALDKGTVPVLLSIDTLKKMKAIVDYGNDEVVFVAVSACKPRPRGIRSSL